MVAGQGDSSAACSKPHTSHGDSIVRVWHFWPRPRHVTRHDIFLLSFQCQRPTPVSPRADLTSSESRISTCSDVRTSSELHWTEKTDGRVSGHEGGGGGGGVSAAAGNRWLRTVSREGGVGDGVGVDTGEGGRGGAAPAQALREGHVACPLEARRQQCTARTWVPADVQARWSVD